MKSATMQVTWNKNNLIQGLLQHHRDSVARTVRWRCFINQIRKLFSSDLCQSISNHKEMPFFCIGRQSQLCDIWFIFNTSSCVRFQDPILNQQWKDNLRCTAVCCFVVGTDRWYNGLRFHRLTLPFYCFAILKSFHFLIEARSIWMKFHINL